MNQLDEYSLERIIPNELSRDEATGYSTLQIHLERYRYACKHVTGNVMDAACGVGYGSEMLAECSTVLSVTGVDVDGPSIAYAKQNYASGKVSYHHGDILQYPAKRAFDSIVSLETIEHVFRPRDLVAKFCQLLKPGGMLIASVPITPSVDANPHHVTDFSAKSFQRLLSEAGFSITDKFLQIQKYKAGSILMRKEKRAKSIRTNLGQWYASHPSKLWLRIWSLMIDGCVNKYMTVKALK
jgi:2-polyprenyl-3-methyl-5-hydroxy-6-metoxy-1,4-benzoquinol methylase